MAPRVLAGCLVNGWGSKPDSEYRPVLVALKLYHCLMGGSAPCPVFLASSYARSKAEPVQEPGSRRDARGAFHVLLSREEENKAQPLGAAKTHKHLHSNMDSPLLSLLSSLLGGGI